MKKFILIILPLICFISLCFNMGFSQVGTSKTELAKPVYKDGIYGGTYQLPNGNVAIFYQTPDGIYAYEFDANSNFIKEYQGNEALNIFNQITNEIDAGLKIYTTAMSVLYAGPSWGTLKLQKGTMFLNSDANFIYGFDYKVTSTEKLKVEDTWAAVPIGNRVIIPDNLKNVLFKGENGKYKRFTFSSLGSSNIAPISGYIQSAGIIREKVNIKNPTPYNSNRLVIFKVGGTPYEETSNIHVMPYAMHGVGTGLSSNGNYMLLTMPLNAPSTVKEQKALVAPDDDRNNLYIYEIDENNQIASEANCKSALRTVNFQAVATNDKTFIIGTGAEGKNWSIFYGGQTAMSGLALVVLNKDGKIASTHTYLEKDLLPKYEVVGQEKSKFQKFTGGPNFYRAEKLENGNTFIYGKSDAYHHGILLSPTNELIKYYVFPHADLTKNAMYADQLEVIGNKIYLVFSDQPFELSNEVLKNTSGNSRIIITTTSQLFEIYHLSQLITIDGTTGKSTQLWLNKIQKDFYSLGSTPALFGKNSIYFAGKIKGLKGKELSVINIPY